MTQRRAECGAQFSGAEGNCHWMLGPGGEGNDTVRRSVTLAVRLRWPRCWLALRLYSVLTSLQSVSRVQRLPSGTATATNNNKNDRSYETVDPEVTAYETYFRIPERTAFSMRWRGAGGTYQR